MVNITWQLEYAARETPDDVGFVDTDETEYTWDQANKITNQVANYLLDRHGLTTDDVVSGIIPNNFFANAYLLGAMKFGAIPTIENHTFPYEVIAENLRKSEPKLFIVADQLFEDGHRVESDVESVEEVIGFNEFQKEFQNYATDLRPTPQRASDTAAVNYTAGTTGPPKGVTITHGMLTHQGATFRDAVLGMGPSDTLMTWVYPYHVGLLATLSFQLAASCPHVQSGGWDAERWLSLHAKYDPDHWGAIAPAMVRDLMQQEEWAEVDLGGTRMILGGAPVPEDIFTAVRDRGGRPTVVYGQTESTGVGITTSPFVGDEDLEMPPDSVGRVIDELAEIKVEDLETGEEVTEPGVEGEICIKGDNLTPGYYNDPARTDEAFDDDGYFHSDDLGYFDDDGYFYITGRVDDMILSGGEKLSLVRLDEALINHERVDDAGTVGVPHDRFGEVPAAFVVPTDPGVDEGELRDILDEYMLEEVARWMRPRLYVKTDEIPRTTAKETKESTKLERQLDGVTLERSDDVLTRTELRNEDRV